MTNFNSKEVVGIFLVVLIVLFLLGFYYFGFSSYDDLDSNNVKHYVFFNNNVDDVIIPISYDKAISTGNIFLCDYVIEENLIEVCKLKLVECSDDACYFDKARFDGDEQMCFKIIDDNLRVGCSSSIRRSGILERSVFNDDISICDSFGVDVSSVEHCRDNYYIAKRFNSNDKSYCDSIVNEVIKNECIK